MNNGESIGNVLLYFVVVLSSGESLSFSEFYEQV